PTDHSGTDPGENSSAHPRLAKQPVQPMQPPEREEMSGVSTPDIEHILRGDKVSEIGRPCRLPRQRGCVEAREVRCRTAVAERAIELGDVRRRIRACGRNEADARMVSTRKAENEMIESRVSSPH